jgi:hypothetical protein
MTSSQSAYAKDAAKRKQPWLRRHPVTGRASSDLLTRAPQARRPSRST